MEPWQFRCECGSDECHVLLTLQLAEYDRARSQEQRFLVAPQHTDGPGEELVETHDRFAVVELPNGGPDRPATISPS